MKTSDLLNKCELTDKATRKSDFFQNSLINLFLFALVIKLKIFSSQSSLSLLMSAESFRLKMRVQVFSITIIYLLIIPSFIEISGSTQFECGIQKASITLVNNGKVVLPREHPWWILMNFDFRYQSKMQKLNIFYRKAALYKKQKGKFEYICGGVLIDTETIVTGNDLEYSRKTWLI